VRNAIDATRVVVDGYETEVPPLDLEIVNENQ
jgi:hypothetical protein